MESFFVVFINFVMFQVEICIGELESFESFLGTFGSWKFSNCSWINNLKLKRFPQILTFLVESFSLQSPLCIWAFFSLYLSSPNVNLLPIKWKTSHQIMLEKFFPHWKSSNNRNCILYLISWKAFWVSFLHHPRSLNPNSNHIRFQAIFFFLFYIFIQMEIKVKK